MNPEEVELEAIRLTLKRMETTQSYVKNYLACLTAMLFLIVLKFVFEMNSWMWT